MNRLSPWRGVTLIELVIVIALLGILVGIALPSYQAHVLKSRRTDAMNALMTAASRQEQFVLDRASYTLDMTELGYPRDPAPSQDGHYVFDAAIGACGSIARCYVLTARPVAGGSQEKDTACTSFSLASSGEQTATGTLGNQCW
jgi:type IV pilus assembly protein PilE